ncbi:MAG: hypothetical protein JNL41_01435 [Phenylobacterium sp.]|uniref:hypothetical protein n=1 Tax=Phenylobacterium sp. TaxID=1871053 RepID=UPI001A5D4827|nr:hypothetical protein [Phenylobacterium sp.]MBL8552911.1 hypothetical protein [Phenylobacterium sp.]
MSRSHSIRSAATAGAALAGVCLSLLAGSARAEAFTETKLAAVMDQVFGQGAWRLTGGYRTAAREAQLRAEGAKTVRPGGISKHSMGRPDAPGAYDVVVDGMKPSEAADRLRAAGAPFARYMPKGRHGAQGPHLHVEPFGFGEAPGGPATILLADAEPPKEGRALSVTIVMPRTGGDSLAAARSHLAGVRAEALKDRADAQLELARAYMIGYALPRDFAAAKTWLISAAANPNADPQTRGEAEDTLAQIPALMEADRAQRPAHYAALKAGAADR